MTTPLTSSQTLDRLTLIESKSYNYVDQGGEHEVVIAKKDFEWLLKEMRRMSRDDSKELLDWFQIMLDTGKLERCMALADLVGNPHNFRQCLRNVKNAIKKEGEK